MTGRSRGGEEGRASIYDRLRQDVETAEDRIRAVSNHDITSRPIPAVEQTWQAVVDRAADGLDVAVVVGSSTDVEREWQGGQALHVLDVRRFQQDRTLHFVLVDDVVYLWLVPSQRDGVHQNGDVTARSDAPGLRAPVESLFERLWREAEPPTSAALH